MDRHLNFSVKKADGSDPDWTGRTVRYFVRTDNPQQKPLPGAVWLDPHIPGRVQLILPKDTPDGLAFNWGMLVDGFKDYTFRANLFPEGDHENGVPTNYTDPPAGQMKPLEPSVPPFPPSGKRSPIAPPWDASDSDGNVATTPPDGWNPPAQPDVLFMRADFNGHILDAARWGNAPFLVNANSNFGNNMLMTPMLPLYDAFWKNACLTEHLEIGMTHFVAGYPVWNDAENGHVVDIPEFIDWAAAVKSMGFCFVLWAGVPLMDNPCLVALHDRKLVDYFINGEEVDGKMTAEEYEAILDNNLAIAPDIPHAAHFTSNYPIHFPRDTFVTNWDKYDGRLHLCWQASQDDSAGRQAALLYYARQRVSLGWQGGNGNPAPNSRVCLFECMASAQLYARCNEDYGNLRTLEGLYAPVRDAGIRWMDGGFGNGGRYADGSVL